MKTKIFYVLLAATIGIAGCSTSKTGTTGSDTVGIGTTTDSTAVGTGTDSTSVGTGSTTTTTTTDSVAKDTTAAK